MKNNRRVTDGVKFRFAKKIPGGKTAGVALFLRKNHGNFQFLQPAAVVCHPLGQIILHPVAVKAHAEPHAGISYDLLLSFVFQKPLHIGMFPVFVDAVVVYIQLPENMVLCHTAEIG